MTMTDEELEQRLSKIEKKQDRILLLLTKTLKVLHILPVTKEEEEKIQLAQRKNMSLVDEVNHELNVRENKPDEGDTQNHLNLVEMFDSIADDVYEDVIGEDYISRGNKEAA